ncbi:unnamed protein product, partial [Polarella glacialis]
PMRPSLLVIACLLLTVQHQAAGRQSDALSWGLGSRLVSVPDLHGDYDRTVDILVSAKLIDPGTLAWVGGNATLVQTGDIVDRGDHGKQIYELMFRLQDEAAQFGGSVVILMGNHELMNIQGDFRYVSTGDFADFGGHEERAAAWAPSGWLGQKVRRFPAAYSVGGVLFVHAGLSPIFLHPQGGESEADAARNIEALNQKLLQAVEQDPGSLDPVLGRDGPMWTRFFAGVEPPCEQVEEALHAAGAERMVVGHTIQQSALGTFRVRSACEGRLLLADTGISSAYGGEESYIEHDSRGGAVAVYPRSRVRDPLPRPSLALIRRHQLYHVLESMCLR